MHCKAFWELYKKDIKEISSVIVIFLFLHILINAFVFFVDIPPRSILHRSIAFMVAMTVYAHPFILVYLYRNEWSSKSNYQMLSLPVVRFVVILSKYLAVLSSCALFSISAYIWSYHFAMRAITLYPSLPAHVFNDILKQPIFYFFITFVFLGMVIFIEAVQYAVKRHKDYIWGGMFVTCAYLYFWIGSRYTDFFDIEMWLLWSEMNLGGIVYSSVSGLLFLFAGVIVYEKYGEV